MAKHAEYRELDSLAVQYVRKMENTPCFINRDLKKADTRFSIRSANMASCTVLGAKKILGTFTRGLADVTQNLQAIHTLLEWQLEAGWDVAVWSKWH